MCLFKGKKVPSSHLTSDIWKNVYTHKHIWIDNKVYILSFIHIHIHMYIYRSIYPNIHTLAYIHICIIKARIWRAAASHISLFTSASRQRVIKDEKKKTKYRELEWFLSEGYTCRQSASVRKRRARLQKLSIDMKK